MGQIINWIIENKEWLFSGLGITIIAFITKKLFTQKDKSANKQTQSQSNSQTQNVTVNIAKPFIAPVRPVGEEKEDTLALTIDGIRAQTNILFH